MAEQPQPSDSLSSMARYRMDTAQKKQLLEQKRFEAMKEAKEAAEELARIERLEPIKMQIRAAMKMDLVFVIDITGSMQPYWDAVVKQVNHIIGSIEDMYENAKSNFRLGFVGYRDVCDAEHTRFMVRPLERVEGSISSVTREWLESIRCNGGGDAAEVRLLWCVSNEALCTINVCLCCFISFIRYVTHKTTATKDVHGALEKAGSAEMLWERDPLMTRTVVHIADAPGHGARLHQGLESAKSEKFDKLPDHDKDGKELERLLRHLRETVKARTLPCPAHCMNLLYVLFRPAAVVLC
ncbi:hypothetical protein TSOC_009473, partial [Tetrabaena socialis]